MGKCFAFTSFVFAGPFAPVLRTSAQYASLGCKDMALSLACASPFAQMLGLQSLLVVFDSARSFRRPIMNTISDSCSFQIVSSLRSSNLPTLLSSWIQSVELILRGSLSLVALQAPAPSTPFGLSVCQRHRCLRCSIFESRQASCSDVQGSRVSGIPNDGCTT